MIFNSTIPLLRKYYFEKDLYLQVILNQIFIKLQIKNLVIYLISKIYFYVYLIAFLKSFTIL